MFPCCLSMFPTVLVETLTFVGQWLRRVLDVAYLCWRASRTSALSSRPVVVRLLPERVRSFTSPGSYLYLLSILYSVLCDICIVRAMCDTVVPAAFIPMTCHRWLMVLFAMTKSNWPVTKSWLFGVGGGGVGVGVGWGGVGGVGWGGVGWVGGWGWGGGGGVGGGGGGVGVGGKVVLVSTLLFKDSMINFTHFCQTYYQVYTHHIDNFSGSDSMSNTMKNKFGKFLQELFSRGVYQYL